MTERRVHWLRLVGLLASIPALACTVRAAGEQAEALTGRFATADAVEVVLRPKAWSKLRVVSAAQHGRAVKKGQIILRLETDELDEAIADKAEEVGKGKLAVAAGAEQLRHLEATGPEKLAAATRARDRAVEDHDEFLETGRELAEKDADMALAGAEFSLAYAKEELRQLEKMYASDDLTEATEEIVLKRQRFVVRRSEHNLRKARAEHRVARGRTIPRKVADLAAARKDAVEELRHAQSSVPAGIEKQRQDLAALRRKQALIETALAELKADRDGMVVRAPADGLVYHGRLERGRLVTAAAVAAKLRPGGSPGTNEVLMTIVSPRPKTVCADVPQKRLGELARGANVTILPVGFDGVELPARVQSVSSVPLPSGSFDVRIALTGKHDRIRPGMTCRIRLPGADPTTATAPAE